jgi:hypothetical protein
MAFAQNKTVALRIVGMGRIVAQHTTKIEDG